MDTALFTQPSTADQAIVQLQQIGPKIAAALCSNVSFSGRKLFQSDSTPTDQFTIIDGPFDITAGAQDGVLSPYT